MTLPPRCHPERLEAMAETAARGISVFTGDDGTCIPYPKVPKGSVKAEIKDSKLLVGLTTEPNLRYFGAKDGWWIVPEVPVVPEFRRPTKLLGLRARRIPIHKLHLGDRREQED